MCSRRSLRLAASNSHSLLGFLRLDVFIVLLTQPGILEYSSSYAYNFS
jgi:hypothetical protein